MAKKQKCPQDCLDKTAYFQAIAVLAGMLAVCFFGRSQYIAYDFFLDLGFCRITRGPIILFAFVAVNLLAVILIKKLWCRHCPGPEEKLPEGRFGFPYIV